MDDVAYEPEEEENEPQSPTGKGWVIQIVGHHFHNEDYHAPYEGRTYLRTTFIESLLGERGEIVTVAAGPMAGEKVLPKDIGIGFPAIIESNPIEDYWVSTAVDSVGDDSMGMGPSRRPTRGFDGRPGRRWARFKRNIDLSFNLSGNQNHPELLNSLLTTETRTITDQRMYYSIPLKS